MSKKQKQRIKSKATKGPGGISCPCCNRGDKSFAKHQYNRDLRQWYKREINTQLDEYYEEEKEKY